MVSSLKSFIKSVRSSKTIAEERSIIRKESAKIRTHFRDVNLDHFSRRILISKLLYLYILGEPTYFGQVECIKLLASNKFLDKKLGYMALSLLLDENQEVLTLLTNSLNNDMNHSNQYVIGLAITTLGNIASPELARDLYTDVEKIITSSNAFLRKKATMCAARLIEKDPDLSDIFTPKLQALIGDNNHAVLLGVSKMIDIIYKVDESQHEFLIKEICPKVLIHLKKLISSGYSPDYDVNGIPDPFLFCSLLATLRLLFENFDDGVELEQFNDLLTQVSSKIDANKNSGHAILYETVKTIFHINSDPSLKVLGVNILGKFLTAKDNNTRYVALNTLLTVVNFEPQLVQRHRSMILSCLVDADISIRRRALELSFGILNEQNIRIITKELLYFLDNADVELKSYVTTQLTLACDKYSPNDKWHFETLVKMLKIGGNHITNDIMSNILALIMQNQDVELTKHVLIKLFQSNYQYTTQYGLNLVTTWCIGEYADLILGSIFEISKNGGEKQNITITEELIVELLMQFIDSTSTLKDQSNVENLISYILTAVLKLSTRFKSASNIEKLRVLLIQQNSSSNLEIQIRSNEYLEIFYQSDVLKKGLLERMPPPQIKHRESITLQKRNLDVKKSHSTGSGSIGRTTTTEDLLLDLMGDDESMKNPINQQQQQQQRVSKQENTVDLLSDIFGSSNNDSAVSTPNTNAGVLDLFNSVPATTVPKPAQTTIPAQQQQQPSTTLLPNDLLQAHNSSKIEIKFGINSIGNGEANLDAYIISTSSGAVVKNINLLVAVPKTQKLKISSMSSNTLLQQGDFIKQNLHIVGKQGGKLKLRIKLSYQIDDMNSVEEQFDFGNFPSTL